MDEPYDPTQELEKLRRISARIQRVIAKEGMPSAQDAGALADGLERLDTYVGLGGDLPDQWDPCFDCEAHEDRRCLRHGKLVPLRRPAYVPGI